MSALPQLGSPSTALGPLPLAAVNVTDFGARGDGTTDDTVAIQAAIDSLPQDTSAPMGGIVYFPQPEDNYRVTDALNLADTRNITLLGDTLNSANEPATTGSGKSTINYTGTDATRLFDCRSTQGFLAHGLAVTHDASWSGIMFDFQHSDTGGDSQHCRFQNCALAGLLQNTCTLISWRNAIFQQVDNCYFGRSAYAIRGRENISTSIAYSNAQVIRNSQFARCNEAIVNPGDQWLIDGCWVEGTGGNIQHFILNDLTTTNIVSNLTITGCWLGDSFSAIPDYWMDFDKDAAGLCTVRNLTVMGTMFNQEQVAKFQGGDRSLVFIGNKMGISAADAVDLGTDISRGIVFIGNDFQSAGSGGVDAIKNRTVHRQKVILGNTWNVNTGLRGYDEITTVGASHIHKSDADAAPTVTSTHANAGSGATVAVTGSDMGGRITLTTGTGAGAGVSNLVVFAFNQTFDSSTPHVVLTPANQAAAALGGWYASVGSVTAFNLGLDTGKSLGSSTAYQFHYQVV